MKVSWLDLFFQYHLSSLPEVSPQTKASLTPMFCKSSPVRWLPLAIPTLANSSIKSYRKAQRTSQAVQTSYWTVSTISSNRHVPRRQTYNTLKHPTCSLPPITHSFPPSHQVVYPLKMSPRVSKHVWKSRPSASSEHLFRQTSKVHLYALSPLRT